MQRLVTTGIIRLIQDPELKQIDSGKSIVKFSGAVNEKFGDKESSHFYNCTSFGKTAENIAKFFKKGDRIYVIGKLTYSSWVGKDDQKKTSLEIHVDQFDFIEGRKEQSQSKNDDEIMF